MKTILEEKMKRIIKYKEESKNSLIKTNSDTIQDNKCRGIYHEY